MGQREPTLELKLADFGNVAAVETGPPQRGASFSLEWATTPEYCAPELFKGIHSFWGDVWSIGVICFELLSAGPVRGQPSDRDWQRWLGEGSEATQLGSACDPGPR